MATNGKGRREQLQSLGLASLWALLGLFGSQIIALILYSAARPVIGPQPELPTQAIFAVLAGIGFVLVSWAYLRVNDREFGYIDVEWPSLAEIGYVVAGVFGLLVGLIAISLVFAGLGVSSAQHGVAKTAMESANPAFVLVFVPISILVIGPTEELFFRNFVQKSLYERFDRRHAVGIASVIFAVVHFPAYMTGTLGQAATSVLVILVLALVLGESYRRTENLTVPILIHGLFNAIQFSLLYVALTSDVAPAALPALL